jgi:hypothetical protein
MRDEGDLVETIAPGYEIYENPDVQMFLRRKRAQIISDEEGEEALLTELVEIFVLHLGEDSFLRLVLSNGMAFDVTTLTCYHRPRGANSAA